MLYGTVAFFMILLSVMGIIHMIVFDSITYIIFPISTLVWGLYKFFKDNDDVFCRRNGVKQGWDLGWLLGLDDDNDGYYSQYDNHYYNRGGSGQNTEYTRYPQSTYRYSNPEYKKILPRCRRNSMVKTEKVKTKEETT